MDVKGLKDEREVLTKQYKKLKTNMTGIQDTGDEKIASLLLHSNAVTKVE